MPSTVMFFRFQEHTAAKPLTPKIRGVGCRDARRVESLQQASALVKDVRAEQARFARSPLARPSPIKGLAIKVVHPNALGVVGVGGHLY
jgi:hypothetical protein